MERFDAFVPRTLTVKRLASSSGLDADELLLLLWDAGFAIDDVRSPLRGDQLRSVRAHLRATQLDRTPTPAPTPLVDEPDQLLVWPELPYEARSMLAVEDVLHVHDEITTAFRDSDDAVDPPGVKDRGALESALSRPDTGHEFGQYKYGSIQLAAAALLHSLIGNHAFHNGNKRTALVAYVWFLRLNGYYLLFQESALYEHVVAIASHGLVDPDLPSWMRADAEVLASYEWTCGFTRAPQTGDQLIDWRRLETILRRHGATFDTPRHNRINIMRGERRSQVKLVKRGMQIEARTVAKIRADLELDEAHGCDSKVFYEDAPRPKDPASIIRRYSSVLRKLSQYDRGEVLVEAEHDWTRH